MSATVRVDHGSGEPVATFVLDRPDKRNALSKQLLDELDEAVNWADQTLEVKAIVLRGNGRGFSAGFDFGEFVDSDQGARALRDTGEAGHRVTDVIAMARPVTIAAIHGHCAGGGVVLALACDLRIAEASATFRIPAIDLGLPLIWGGIPRLTRELGPAVTKELLLTGRRFGAEEAQRFGLVNRVVADGTVAGAAKDLAEALGEKPAFGLESTKRHVNAVTEDMASVGRSHNDPDTFVVALENPESQAALRSYLAQTKRA